MTKNRESLKTMDDQDKMLVVSLSLSPRYKLQSWAGYAITLHEGTAPISVCPYRYPHAQKDEIEKLIREMLKVGIIQPSTSLFSSPVFLVKKKRRKLEVLCGLSST